MLVKEFLHKYRGLHTDILLCHVLNKPKSFLYTYPDYKLSPAESDLLIKLIDKRKAGTPIAYLTGKREFWSLDLLVNKHTLIPRHETELLVEKALDILPKDQTLNIADLGTGSGAIAIALKKERPNWNVFATDKSKNALDIAKQNAKLHSTEINFYCGDWLAPLPNIQFDAIISNPPYISANDPHLGQGDVKFEPKSALIADDNGLADIQTIAKQALDYLKPNAILMFEHGYQQKDAIHKILDAINYRDIYCHKDLSNNDRITLALMHKEC